MSFSEEARGPAFIGIGAMRAGTSWLDTNLRAHPDIWLPPYPIKELHYFDQTRVKPFINNRYVKHLKLRARWNKELLFSNRWSARNFWWDVNYFCRPRSDRWYASLFPHRDGRLCGEITPDYSVLSPEQVAVVRGINPGLKILFIMRDPIDRSWSQAVKTLASSKNRRITSVPESELIDFLYSPQCLSRSDYLTTMKTWLQYFPENQFLIGYFDEIKTYPKEFLLRVFDFLGIESSQDYITASVEEPVSAIATQHGHNEIPERIAYELARIYRSKLEQLAAEFGKIPAEWHRKTLKLLEDRECGTG